jgi:hypothetical protein
MTDPRQITIQVFSDLHLNLLNSKDTIPPIMPEAKYLFLAGNICTLNHSLFFPFLDHCSRSWEKTFIVPGNQEFYSYKKNHGTLDFEYNLKIGERYKNIFYLNNGKATLNDVIDVYGTTLWSKPRISRYEAKYFTDFFSIQQFSEKKKLNIPIDYHFIQNLSNKDSDFLAESIRKNKNKKLIVLTHFPPTQEGTINPSTTLYEDFGNLLDRVDLRNVPLWISGHTHWSYNIELPSTRLVSNQLGFVSEKTGYSKNGLFVIDY